MAKNKPQVVPLASVEVRAPEDAPTKVRIARMITNARCGSNMLLGVAWVQPGEKTNRWSTQADDELEPNDHHYGYLEEVYFILHGNFRLTWDEGVLEFGPNDAVYLPAGWQYRLECVGDVPGMLVYGFSPTPE